jgi:phage gpG-like protein
MNAKRFSAVMRSLAKVPAQASRKSAADISREIQRSMDASKDPDGGVWQPKKNGRPSILKKTGVGRASIKVTPTSGAGMKITVGVKYMIYHQFGGASHLRGPGGSYKRRKENKHFGTEHDQSEGRSHPPKRSFLPFKKLPDRWGAIILGNIEAAAKQVLR